MNLRHKRFEQMKRLERKRIEYKMAVVRTVFNVIGGVAAAVGLMVSLLIYHKVYFNGGG